MTLSLIQDVTSNDHLPMPETRTLKNQVRTLTQEKLFAEAQRGELEEDLKKVSAEKDLVGCFNDVHYEVLIMMVTLKIIIIMLVA